MGGGTNCRSPSVEQVMKRYPIIVASICAVALGVILSLNRLGITQDGSLPMPKGKKGPPPIGAPSRAPNGAEAFGQGEMGPPSPPAFGGGFDAPPVRGGAPGVMPPMGPHPPGPHHPPGAKGPHHGGPPAGPHAGPHPPHLSSPMIQSLEQADPELFKLVTEDDQLERKSFELAEEIRRLAPAERTKRETELQTLLVQHFEVRQSRRALQIERMAEQIKTLRESLEKRTEARDAIIERRMRELLGKPQDLEF